MARSAQTVGRLASVQQLHKRSRSRAGPLRRGDRRTDQCGHVAFRATEFLAFVPPVCFDKGCQATADAAFLASILVPLLAAVGVLAYQLRPIPDDLQRSGRIFEDKNTGAVFEAEEGVTPERDKNGELAFKAISYTPWPVASDDEGERVRIDVGPVNARKPQTYVFKKELRQPSEIVKVTLPRPSGLIVEEDAVRKRAIIGDVVKKSPADQKLQLAQFDRSRRGDAALVGDVVRAFTATNLVYGTKSLTLGIKPPQRVIVVYGADQQRWPKVAAALKQGLAEDGSVTFILERKVETL